MRRISLFLSLVFVMLAAGRAGAQQSAPRPDGGRGTVRGMVIDAKTSQPVEYANVALYRAADSTLVTGGVTDPQGRFVLENAPFGSYYLRVSFMGYAPKQIDNLALRVDADVLALGRIPLESSAVELGTVEVAGERPSVVNNLDKRVFNVEKNIASSGGTALDVMENIPSVTVTAEGGVQLRGNANVNVLIDGRPSGLSGVSSGDVLGQIPASSIEYVELVTNPSARNDPDGTAGMINIVLKKRSNEGVNGMATLNAGNGDRYNGSLNLNWRRGVVNLFGSYDNRFNRFSRTETTLRSSTADGTTTLLDQNSRANNRMNFHTFNLGMDITPAPSMLLTLGGKFRTFTFRSGSVSGDLSRLADGSDAVALSRTASFARAVDSWEYTLNWKNTWQPRVHELTADVYLTRNQMERDDQSLQSTAALGGPSTPFVSQRRGESANAHDMWVAQANYIRPVFGGMRLETGVKSQIRDLSSSNLYERLDPITGTWIFDAQRGADDFRFDEAIHAAYAIVSDEAFGVKYQLGLRGEYVVTDPRSAGDTRSYRSTYTSLYPTVHLVAPLAAGHEAQLSYSRRVDRPHNRQINPYVDVSDSLNIQAGNPYLRPQYIDSYELGHAWLGGRSSLTSTVFYRRTTDLIERITVLEAGSVTRSSWDNIAESVAWGLEVTGAYPVADWWRLNASASYYRLDIRGTVVGQPIDDGSFSWNTKLNSTMTLWWDLQLQALANYTAPVIEPQERDAESYWVDLALRREFFRGDLTVTVRATDVFNTRRDDSEYFGTGFYSQTARKMDSRVLYLGLSWRINSELRQRERERPRGPQGEGMDEF